MNPSVSEFTSILQDDLDTQIICVILSIFCVGVFLLVFSLQTKSKTVKKSCLIVFLFFAVMVSGLFIRREIKIYHLSAAWADGARVCIEEREDSWLLRETARPATHFPKVNVILADCSDGSTAPGGEMLFLGYVQVNNLERAFKNQ